MNKFNEQLAIILVFVNKLISQLAIRLIFTGPVELSDDTSGARFNSSKQGVIFKEWFGQIVNRDAKIKRRPLRGGIR